MQREVSDSSLYYRLEDKKLIEITGNYVNDNANAGNIMFETYSELTLLEFESKPREYDDFSVFGTGISTIGANTFAIHQGHYISALSSLLMDADMNNFRRAWALLPWISDTIPEATRAVNKLVQVTDDKFKQACITISSQAARQSRKNSRNKTVVLSRKQTISSLSY